MIMKKSILNLEGYGVVELNHSECQSIEGGVMFRLGQLVGHLHNAWDALVGVMCTGGELVQSNLRR